MFFGVFLSQCNLSMRKLCVFLTKYFKEIKMVHKRDGNNFTLVIILIIALKLVLSFNIDINSRYEFQSSSDDYFGYSLAFYKTR